MWPFWTLFMQASSFGLLSYKKLWVSPLFEPHKTGFVRVVFEVRIVQDHTYLPFLLI